MSSSDDAPDLRVSDPSRRAELTGRRSGVLRRLRLRPYLSESDRVSARDALMVTPTSASLRRFSVLLCLSVVVAAVGLLENSTAVVIGAMMIAPLMAPIMGVAASLVMGWGRRLLTGATVVAVSVAVAVGIAWAVARFLPQARTGLPSEVLARTSPDVRDLLIALAAGAAGSYATVRRDVSGALPGVAVAVALVPPLACVGVLIGRGQPDLAGGAELLFATNLFGIILAAAVVFILTGFVPADHFHTRRRRILATLLVTAVPTIAVAAVLTDRFLGTVDHARELKLATQATQAWLGSADNLNRISLTDSTVHINITGKNAPPPIQTLTASLTATLGHTTTADLRWTPIRGDEPTPAPPPLDAVDPVVQKWLAKQSLILDGLAYNSAGLLVTASGEHPPRNADELTALLRRSFATAPPVSLSWTHRTPKTISTTATDAATARTTTDGWITSHPGATVLGVDQTDTTTTVTITAPLKPTVDDLQSRLRAALPAMAITIQWIPGSVLSEFTPTPPPRATTGVTPTQPAPATAPTTPVPTPTRPH